MASKASAPKYKLLTLPEDELVCVACLEVGVEPWEHFNCGRLLCKKCFDKLEKDKPCPSCENQEPQFFRDDRRKRVTENLPVKCSNVDTGEGVTGWELSARWRNTQPPVSSLSSPVLTNVETSVKSRASQGERPRATSSK